jgi:hypothetical protein
LIRIKNLSWNVPAGHVNGDAVEAFTATLLRERHSSSSATDGINAPDTRSPGSPHPLMSVCDQWIRVFLDALE